MRYRVYGAKSQCVVDCVVVLSNNALNSVWGLSPVHCKVYAAKSQCATECVGARSQCATECVGLGPNAL